MFSEQPDTTKGPPKPGCASTHTSDTSPPSLQAYSQYLGLRAASKNSPYFIFPSLRIWVCFFYPFSLFPAPGTKARYQQHQLFTPTLQPATKPQTSSSSWRDQDEPHLGSSQLHPIALNPTVKLQELLQLPFLCFPLQQRKTVTTQKASSFGATSPTLTPAKQETQQSPTSSPILIIGWKKTIRHPRPQR